MSISKVRKARRAKRARKDLLLLVKSVVVS